MARKKQAGFTLIELMLASTLGLILLISALGILYDSANIGDVLRSRVSLNAAARESFDLLLDGGRSGSDDVFGLRGLDVAPGSADLQVPNGFRVQILNNGAADALEGPRAPSRTIDCIGEADPIPACTAAGSLTAEGYLAGLTVFNAERSIKDEGGSGDDRTGELELTLFNPYLIGRPDTPTQQATEIYRTIFLLNRD